MQNPDPQKLRYLLSATLALAMLSFAPPALARLADLQPPGDERIALAVADRLILDHGVQIDGIDVGVEDGVITLSGRTRTLLAKRRAETLAEAVRGVRAIVNNIEVDAPDRLDRDIASDVRAALLVNPATDAYEIDVRVELGVAYLSGEVQSFTELELAETIAASVHGVVDVQNRVTYEYATDRNDSEIGSDVRSALRWDALVRHDLISVEVEDRHVTLSGSVGSLTERRSAVADAWVDGVLAVDADQLVVEPWAERPMQRDAARPEFSEDDIRAAVNKTLDMDPRVSDDRIDVYVVDDAVTLRGEVNSLAAKRAARQDALNVVGVRRVRSFVQVAPQRPRPSDIELLRKSRQALEADAEVTQHEITLAASSGEINLSGAVDSRFEKARAEAVIARIEGVVDIHNDLRVIDPGSQVGSDAALDWSAFDYDWPRYATVRTRSDRSIVEDIYNEYAWSPFVDGDSVVVEVEDGVATLSGTVDSWTERREAANNALQGGAIRVINRLVVETPDPASAPLAGS